LNSIQQKYRFDFGLKAGVEVILISFPYDTDLIAFAKKEFFAKWSKTLATWYVVDTPAIRLKLGLAPKLCVGKASLSHISEVNRPPLERLVETIQLKGYSQNTLVTYRNEFAQLLHILGEVPVHTLNEARVRSYFLYCTKTLKLSENTLHSRINAIKFYFEQVLGRERFFIEIPRPKKHEILPKAIHQLDIKKLFEVTTNLKHNTMLKICYGMGLRVSEIIGLKITDIDSKAMQVLVERGKGKKDRYVHLPDSVLSQLRTYFKEYQPKIYLFEGQYGGQYSIRSAQKVFSGAMQKAKINKVVGIHGLRHSYATHLLEAGTDIVFIKELLGHNDLKTTLRYTHISTRTIKNIKSPLDQMSDERTK
jgi:integrase/recombinase XerD